MPPKSRKQQSRRNKVPTQKSITSLTRRAKLNNFTMPQMIRATGSDFNSGGTGSAVSTFFLNYPTYFRNNGGSIAQMGSVASILANEQKVFDEYKVLELSLSYIPFEQNSLVVASYTTASGNTGVNAVAPLWDPSIITAVDLDDGANWTTVSKALNAQGANVRMRTSNKVIPLMKFRQVDELDSMKWLNLGSIVPNVTTPPDPNNPSKLATIKIWTGVHLTLMAYPVTNTTVGAFLAEWLVLLRGTYTLS